MALIKKHNKQPTGRRPLDPNRPRQSFSYYHSTRTNQPASTTRAADKSTSAKEPAGRHWLAQLSRGLLALFVVVCLISVLQINRTNPRVVVLNPQDNYQLHSLAAYRAQITEELQSDWANTTKLTVDTSALAGSLMARYPEISDASVVLPLISHRPTVYIELAQPTLQLNTASQHVAVGSNGQALSVAGAGQPLEKAQLPIISDETTLHFTPGDIVLPSGDVAFIKTVLAQLAAGHVTVGKMVLPRASEEFDLYPGGAKYYVKFNLHADNARQQVGTYLAVRDELAKHHKVPKHYIDVRLPGRAYYK